MTPGEQPRAPATDLLTDTEASSPRSRKTVRLQHERERVKGSVGSGVTCSEFLGMSTQQAKPTSNIPPGVGINPDLVINEVRWGRSGISHSIRHSAVHGEPWAASHVGAALLCTPDS